MTDATRYRTEDAGSINTDAGLIGLAAALSVTIPIICVFLVKFRKAKKQELARRRALENSRESRSSTDLRCDPPPSYELVVDHINNSILPAHSRSGSSDVLIQENEAHSHIRGVENGNGPISILQDEQFNRVGSADESANASANSLIDHQETGINPPDFNTAVLAMPGFTEASNLDSSDTEGSLNEREHAVPRLFPRQITSRWSNNCFTISSFQSPSSSPPPPPESSSNQSGLVAPPFWFRFAKKAASNRNSSENARIHETASRIPGMHISVQDFYNHEICVPDDESVAPPPSYDEALKILQSASHATDADKIDKPQK